MRVHDVPQLPLADLTAVEAASRALFEAAKSDHSLWVVTADVMYSLRMKPFADAFPERFINVGIAEQTMLGITAGLATCGKTPFAAAFSAMLSMRTCEQIRTDVAYPNLNVKLFATYGGISAGKSGPSHHATEDIAIMRSMANMAVVVPADVWEIPQAIQAAIAWRGPVYLRFGRWRDPIVYSKTPDFRIGKANLVREGTDVALIACGRTLAECVVAARMLETEGVSARVLDMHTVKPIDEEAIRDAVSSVRMLFTVEEHNVLGGLGGAVAEVVADLGSGVPLKRLGLPDIYSAIGAPEELYDKYGISGPRIAETVLESLEERDR